MKILTVCIKKNKKESWFLRIPTPPSPLSKASESYKRTFKTITVPYVSVPSKKHSIDFWVTLILSPDSLSCALGTERAREENNKMRKTLRGRGGALGGRCRHLAPVTDVPDRRGRQILISSSGWQPISFQLSSSPLSVFSQIFSPFPQILHTSLNCTHANTIHTYSQLITHICTQIIHTHISA